MRIGIFSDTHANLEALQAVVKAYEKDSRGQYPTTRIQDVRVVKKTK